MSRRPSPAPMRLDALGRIRDLAVAANTSGGRHATFVLEGPARDMPGSGMHGTRLRRDCVVSPGAAESVWTLLAEGAAVVVSGEASGPFGAGPIRVRSLRAASPAGESALDVEPQPDPGTRPGLPLTIFLSAPGVWRGGW